MNAHSKKPQAATVEKELQAMDAQNNNLRIWNAVCVTDPKHTKPVEFGRKFTAIDAHYQIQEATRVFGPVGEGWGYDTGEMVFADGLVIVPVTLWHGDRNKSFGPIYGSTTLRDRKGNIDKDAPKKATTDALTKALSQLGFNADVFLGRFDDNKYVEEMKERFGPKPDEPKAGETRTVSNTRDDPFPQGPAKNKTQLKEMGRAFWKDVEACGDSDELECLLADKNNVALVNQLMKALPQWWDGGTDRNGEVFEGLEQVIARQRRDFEQTENA